MKKTVFVVLRKYYHVVGCSVQPFSADGGDILLFPSYDEARGAALKWCGQMARQVSILCDYDELSATSAQYDDHVFRCVGRENRDAECVRVEAEIYQKYV